MNKKYWPYYRLIQDINLNDSLTMGECRERAHLERRIECAEISKTRAPKKRPDDYVGCVILALGP